MRTLILLLLPALHLYAQQSWDALRQLKPGVRVRVLEIVGTEHKGAFGGVSADAITLQTGTGEAMVERSLVRRVQIPSGARRVRNVVIGAAIGVAVGVTVDQTLGSYFRNESGETAGARAVTYIAPTGLFGGIAAAMGSWQTVYRR
jgi:hypothetical protein